jgi:hypothetical protein
MNDLIIELLGPQRPIVASPPSSHSHRFMHIPTSTSSSSSPIASLASIMFAGPTAETTENTTTTTLEDFLQQLAAARQALSGFDRRPLRRRVSSRNITTRTQTVDNNNNATLLPNEDEDNEIFVEMEIVMPSQTTTTTYIVRANEGQTDDESDSNGARVPTSAATENAAVQEAASASLMDADELYERRVRDRRLELASQLRSSIRSLTRTTAGTAGTAGTAAAPEDVDLTAIEDIETLRELVQCKLCCTRLVQVVGACGHGLCYECFSLSKAHGLEVELRTVTSTLSREKRVKECCFCKRPFELVRSFEDETQDEQAIVDNPNDTLLDSLTNAQMKEFLRSCLRFIRW